MQSTPITPSIKRNFDALLQEYPLLMPIAQVIAQKGGTTFVVGGAVRDLLLNIPVKDLDCEVHGITLEELEKILRAHGAVSMVGKSFGVLRIAGVAIDWSLPRQDSAGRKPTVHVNPTMDIREAFARRDLTMNAMGIDVIREQLVDPWGGQADMHAKRLRTPNATFFVQDPLRFWRVMQFIGRFGMQPDEELTTVCKTMDVRSVSLERIETEFEKLFLRSTQPSLGIRWLNDIGRLEELLPELAATKNVPQEHDYHPEGDVFEHSMQAVDAAAALSYDTIEHQLLITTAALCHDLGKATTTVRKDGRWRSYGHEQAGVPLAQQVLKRMTTKKYLIDDVALLVRHHMAPVQFASQNAGAAAYKRLARALAPTLTLQLLAQLSLADKRARNGAKHIPLTENIEGVTLFIERAQQAGVLTGSEAPVLVGADLLDVIPAGPALGALLKKAYDIQINEGIRDKDTLKKLVLHKSA